MPWLMYSQIEVCHIQLYVVYVDMCVEGTYSWGTKIHFCHPALFIHRIVHDMESTHTDSNVALQERGRRKINFVAGTLAIINVEAN